MWRQGIAGLPCRITRCIPVILTPASCATYRRRCLSDIDDLVEAPCAFREIKELLENGDEDRACERMEAAVGLLNGASAIMYLTSDIAPDVYTKIIRQWFEHLKQAYLVLWWIPEGKIPSVEEGMGRLELLRRNGPTADAFAFRKTFPPPPHE
jgi:hypothetical protein